MFDKKNRIAGLNYSPLPKLNYHGFFVLLHLDWSNPFQDIRKKEEALCLSC